MSLIDRTGTFRGYVTDSCVTVTRNGFPQFEARLHAIELYDEENEQWIDWSEYDENELTAYLTLFGGNGNPTLSAEQLQKALGWDGASLASLDEADYSKTMMQFRVDENTYEGKTTLRVQWVDHADAEPGKTIRRLDANEIKGLDAKYAAALRKLSGGVKPKKVDKPKPPTPVEDKIEPADANSVEDAKAAAKAKYDEKKARAEKAEAKAVKSKKPPIPGKKKAEPTASGLTVAEKLELPPTCSMDDAWEAVNEHASKLMTPQQISEAWLEVIENFGGEDAVNDMDGAWANVRNVVIEKTCDDA